MSEVRLDKERSAAFMANMTGIMNGGALALMCSIGHKTGLFDTMAGMAPATSSEIADAAGLDERYVREWLAAMTAGEIVDHDPPAGTYVLPAEHSGLLTRAAGPLNLTTYCQYVSLLGQVEDEVVDAFRNGGGVPYERYPQFQTLMAESSGQRLSQALIPQVVPLLPGGAERLDTGIDVADIGCGSGRALNLLASTYPRSRFTGFDIARGALDQARADAEAAGNTNVEFVERDAAQLGEDARFDLATSFDAVHDQAHPDAMIAGIFAALRPGGAYLCVEPKASSHLHENLDLPMAPMMYTISTMHCMTVSLAYGGQGLGTAWGEQLAVEKLGNAGFVEIEVTGIKADRANHYLLATKPGGDRPHHGRTT
ncbi:MAG: class I SAM-dependent methyltransferase [Acidimicrobiia bacterium]|nr:class I SAM-dependent methyltransferase [Acidimicrobiia bacterium]